MKLSGKNILITGAGGFIGSHLTEELLDVGANVSALIHYNSRNNIGWLKDIPQEYMKNINLVFGDLTSQESVEKTIKNNDIIFHLGALISIPYSYINPRSYFKVNVEGTLNILSSCINSNIERIIQTSTSEVYGTPKTLPISEKHPLQPQSPYAASKVASDKLAESFYCTYDLPITIVRPFNTYGPRQSARAVIPTIISQILTGEEVKIGTLTTTRDFNYVKDTVQGFIQASLQDTLIGETVNLGTEEEYSIKQIIDILSDITGIKVKISQDSNRIRPEKSEVLRLLANTEKMKKTTGWRPSFSLREGLENTVNWTKVNLDEFRPNEYNI